MSALPRSIENPMVLLQPEQSSATVIADWDYKVARALDRVTTDDALDQLADSDYEEELRECVARNDLAGIGRLFMRARRDMAEGMVRFSEGV